jgi:drug/metabolite transporter (DMT)-like permease
LANKYASPTTLSLFFFISVPLTYLLDIVFIGTRPGAIELFGSSVVIGVSTLKAYIEYQKKNNKNGA